MVSIILPKTRGKNQITMAVSKKDNATKWGQKETISKQNQLFPKEQTSFSFL